MAVTCLRYLFGVMPTLDGQKSLLREFQHFLIASADRKDLAAPDWNWLFPGQPAPNGHLPAMAAIQANFVLQRLSTEEERVELMTEVTRAILSQASPRLGDPATPDALSTDNTGLAVTSRHLHLAAMEAFKNALLSQALSDAEVLELMQTWITKSSVAGCSG